MDALQSSQRFQGYLFSGERVLWTGEPKQGIRLSPLDVFAIPFSLFWTGMVLFMFTATLDTPGFPDVVLVLFLVFGLYFTVGRFVHDAALRKRIHYAVTNERVLVISGLVSPKLTSLDLQRLPRLELSEHRNGTGTISFDRSGWMSNFGRYNGFSMWVPSLGASSQFFGIENPRRVYELIRNQFRA
jgi:hypothetical protein